MNRCNAIRIAVLLFYWCQLAVKGQQAGAQFTMQLPGEMAVKSRLWMPKARAPSNAFAFASSTFPTQPTVTNEHYLSAATPNYPPSGQFFASPMPTQQIPSNGRQPFPNVSNFNYRTPLSSSSSVAGQLYPSAQNEMTAQHRKAHQQQQLGNYLNALHAELHPEGFRIEGDGNSGTTVPQNYKTYPNPFKKKFNAATNLVNNMVNDNTWVSFTGGLPIVNGRVNVGLNGLDSGLGVFRRIR